MKFEEKMNKNKNYEISHIVRPKVSPEVYNQKQNTLFISECVARTGARLHSSLRTTPTSVRLGGSLGSDICYARLGRDASMVRSRCTMHGRVHSGVCTTEYIRAYARPSARVRRIRGLAVRDNGSDGCAAPLFVAHVTDECAARRFPWLGYLLCTTRMGARLGWLWCTAWSGRVHGSVATHIVEVILVNSFDMEKSVL